MTQEFIIDFGKEALLTTLLLSAPMLGFGLIVGILVSIFQAVTSIHEMTLTFIPKILAVMFALILFLPWMLQFMVGYTTRLFINIPMYIH
ncbi:MAG: flagellar biosynthesis protein FliQ [Nitrospinae bacterium]|nr:flagellar biosynthesis protein FliQ [Nitrospinota bacterium]